jgi:ParB family transcriptional regulator, chromosome partitioning protein
VARKVLGQGLKALIPEDSQLVRDEVAPQKGLALLPLDVIQPNPMQPRQQFQAEAIAELAASIKEQGLLQPIVVRKTKAGYEVVVGERRVRAARIAGLEQIPAVIRDDVEDTRMLSLALVENIQREDLDPIEEARAFKELMTKASLTQQKLALTVGKSREAIANALRLLKLPSDIQRMVAEGQLSAGHARPLLAVEHTVRQRALAQAIATKGLSVREVERLVSAQQRQMRTPRPKDPDVEALELRLEDAVAAKVRLKYRGQRGRIEIYFETLDELDRIITLLQR